MERQLCQSSVLTGTNGKLWKDVRHSRPPLTYTFQQGTQVLMIILAAGSPQVRKTWLCWVTFCIGAILSSLPFLFNDQFIFWDSLREAVIKVDLLLDLLLTGVQLLVKSFLDEFQWPLTPKPNGYSQNVTYNQKLLLEMISQWWNLFHYFLICIKASKWLK